MAVKTITLASPIEINGKQHSELTYDTDEITISQFAEAERAAKKKASGVVTIAEFDSTLHFYLGAYSVIAINPHIDITDLERIKGRDLMSVIGVGRFFTMSSEESDQSSLDEPSETTPESSQPQSKTSTKCD